MRSKKSHAKMYIYFIFFPVIFLVMSTVLQAGTIMANAGTHPSTVYIGQPTEIRVEVFSNQGTPIAYAYVKISAGGGVFLNSNNTVIEGQTDSNGMFAAPWKCHQCAPAYVFNIEVNKPGFKGWMGEARVNITNQPLPGQGSQIIVNAGTHPPVVSKGQPTIIRVEAFSDKGFPIPKAHVKISAGGGIFIDSNTTFVEGYTEVNGVFETPWKCIQCAPAYVFGIEVNKPGFKKGATEARVNIASQVPGKSLKLLKPLPDIAISSVHIYPSQPGSGKKFTAVVYITNKGHAVSGKFDLAVYMKDVTRGHIYPVGTFRRDAMQPGEQIPWQKQDLMVNNPGSYQFWVEIKPFLFKDLDNKNNILGWSFQVN